MIYLATSKNDLTVMTLFNFLCQFRITRDFFSVSVTMFSNLFVPNPELYFTHFLDNFVLSLAKHLLHRQNLSFHKVTEILKDYLVYHQEW